MHFLLITRFKIIITQIKKGYTLLCNSHLYDYNYVVLKMAKRADRQSSSVKLRSLRNGNSVICQYPLLRLGNGEQLFYNCLNWPLILSTRAEETI